MPKQAQPVYVRPVKGVFQRVDEGVDYKGTPGDHVVAMGNARIDYIKSDPGGFGNTVYYTLLDGPEQGQQIYVGHAQPTVKAGQTVRMGAPVANLLQHPGGNAREPGWVEIGFANGGRPLATSDVGQDVAGTPGKRFLEFVNNLYTTPPTTGGNSSPAATDIQQSTAGAPGLIDTSPAHPSDIQQNTGVSAAGPGMEPTQLANLWEQIANQQYASPETRTFAQNSKNSLP